MTAQKIQKDSSWMPPAPEATGLLASRPFAPVPVQQQIPASPIQTEKEDESIDRNKTDSLGLQRKPQGTAIAPVSPPNQGGFAHNFAAHNVANVQVNAPVSPAVTPVQPKLVIQTKLTIGEPGDQYEEEADRMAEAVVQRLYAPKLERSQPMPAVQPVVQREIESGDDELQRSWVQRRSDAVSGAASPELETEIQQARGGGQPLANSIRQPMEQAFGFDFSRVKIHADGQADQLNRSIQAKAFTTGQDVFFRQGAYDPGSRGGQELIAHELTHVVQQGGSSQVQSQSSPSVAQRTLQPLTIQRTPEDVWDHVDTLDRVTTRDAKYILQMDFCSNWFLAQEYLLSPDKWVDKHQKPAEVVGQRSGTFKKLMKTLLKLRQEETEQLLTDVRTQLMTQPQFKDGPEKSVLDWGSAGSQSLTSDIDVNLKGAGSIQAVPLFNSLFKTKLGWTLDPGTVYDVNVYAQDFMTPSAEGKPFVKDNERNTIAPIQEINELNGPEASHSPTATAFDAFALNQDVWSLVKMRMYMSGSEWNRYCQDMIDHARGDGSPDSIARGLQIEAQIDDANGYYADYKKNLEGKIHEIEQSGDILYQNMRNTLAAGSTYLSEHQQEASKKMMASNLIYKDKLDVVSQLRQKLNALKATIPAVDHTELKNVGIQLKNALSEAIMYSNEAYFTQGAVHFSVIGQQIGKGQSRLIMSDDEHLHSFREQIGDTLKVLNEYQDAPIEKAILKAGKYIDRMAKSAIPLISGNLPNGYQELAYLGAMAAKLKSDKTDREDLKDKPANTLTADEQVKLSTLDQEIPNQEATFKILSQLQFETVPILRETITTVGQKVEKNFRESQLQKNLPQPQPQANPQTPPQNTQLAVVQQNIQAADEEVGCFSGLISALMNIFRS